MSLDTNQIVLAMIAAITTFISAYLAWKQNKEQQKSEVLKTQKDAQTIFITEVIDRVETLETRVDNLSDKVVTTARAAEEQRRLLEKEHKDEIKSLRAEMQKLIDSADLAVATWRDKYFTLLEQYTSVRVKCIEQEQDLKLLRETYEALKEKYEMKRVYRDIEDTP